MTGSEHDSPVKVVPLKRRRTGRRSTSWWRWSITLFLGLGVIGAAWVYFNGIESTGRLPQWVPAISDLTGSSAPAPGGRAYGQAIAPLSPADEAALDRQRDFVESLAHRHVGAGLRRTADDLRVLQMLLDQRVLGPEQKWELQALGVVLGDVFEREFGLSWVVVNDEYGRSRALQYKNSDDLIFPVTMISRRAEKNIPVDVNELYRNIEDIIKQLDARKPRLRDQ